MELVLCDYGNPLAVGKEYKLCRVKTIRVTVSMVKDCDQHINVSISVSLNVRLSVSLSVSLSVNLR